jgi:hypothetical protein
MAVNIIVTPVELSAEIEIEPPEGTTLYVFAKIETNPCP